MQPVNIGGNYFDKYASRNPVVRYLTRGFLESFDALCAQTGARTVFEYGCGEGHLSLRLLARGIVVRGADVDGPIVAEANMEAQKRGFGAPFFVEDVMQCPDEIRGELVVCCEVLEHLQDPEAALERIKKNTSEWVLLSVPREPIWRMLNMMRLSYLTDFGNTPGHVQHWSVKGFVRMVEKHFEIVAMRQPLPWTFLLCRKRA